MAKLFIEDSTLTAIGDAIRSKTNTTDAINPSAMATMIYSIEEDVPSPIRLCTKNSYRFYGGYLDWLITNYGNRIETYNLSETDYMFYKSDVTSIPFDFNYQSGLTSTTCKYMFYSCGNLKSIGTFFDLSMTNANHMFYGCTNLRYLPTFENLALGLSTDRSWMFSGCYSLRSIPEDFLKTIGAGYGSSAIYNCGFQTCYVLDEIKGLTPYTTTVETSNRFSKTFTNCRRVKDIMFAVQEDGTPYSVSWKNQTIDLTNIGYAANETTIIDYNSGITADKAVTDAETYAALKDDPDWFTLDAAYSRYNHDSAVNTINSLPDTYEYVTAQSGTNTITFTGEAGSSTDGGAINTLTEEEIAVATAKGWTVSLV